MPTTLTPRLGAWGGEKSFELRLISKLCVLLWQRRATELFLSEAVLVVDTSKVDIDSSTVLMGHCYVSGTLSCALFFPSRSKSAMMISNDISLDRVPSSLLFFAIYVFEHVVHLLQSSPTSLRNKEKCPHQRQKTEDGKEGVGPVTGVLHQRRSDQPLSPVD